MKGMWRSNFGGDDDDDSAMHYLEKLRHFDPRTVTMLLAPTRPHARLECRCCDYVPSPRALRFGPHEYGYTPEKCATKCRGYSPPYRFSAVQDGSWCSCDSDFTRVKMYGATSSYIEVVWATYGGNCGRASNNQLANLVATCSGLEKCYYNIGSGLDIGYEVGATIEVTSATYGGNCDGANSDNQLGNLAKECNGKTSCSYDVNHKTIGDPAYGCAKTYEYKWNCGATSFSETASAEASGTTITLDCPADPCANSAKEYEYMFKCSAGDTALWSSGARPSCQEYGGTVWAMCNGKPYKPSDPYPCTRAMCSQAIRDCNYAYTNPAGSHYATLCPKLYTVAAEARGQNVALSCSEEVGGQPEINSCQPNGGAWCNVNFARYTR